MLHILNGESTESVLAETLIAGERFSFADALIGGPTPADVRGAEWRRIRATHLANAYGVEFDKSEQRLARQEGIFASFPDHEEVVLWFESDLFCQVNMLYVLDWFAQRDLDNTKLTLICIGEFPGRPNFRGLGELNPEELASLFETRNAVSAAELELAREAWRAYRSPDPRAIADFLKTETSILPFLKNALQLHLERFPAARNGLGRIENRGLEFVSSGATRFRDLFPKFADAEAGYGLGDAQFWNALQDVIRAAHPLLRSSNGVGSQSTGRQSSQSKDLLDATFEITETGRAVLNDDANFVAMNGIDAWLGGVHLQGTTNVWRWDEQNRRLMFE